MPPEGRSTNIRVFIKWDDQTVFAGEDIRCQITFKNVAASPGQQQRPPLQSSPKPDRPRQPSPLLSPRGGTSNGLTPPSSARSHRSTLSLNVPSTGSRLRNSVPQWPPPQLPVSPPVPAGAPAQGHAHKRSLSIVSMGSNAAAVDDQVYSNGPQTRPQRPTRGHGRSASLQIIPRAGAAPNGPQSAALPRRSPFSSDSSPVFNNHSFPPAKQGLGRTTPAATGPNTPSLARAALRRKSSGPMPDFKFPMAPAPSTSDVINSPTLNGSVLLPVTETASQVTLPVRSKDPIPTISEHSAPVARVLSTTSMAGGTPRSSGEFYSLSNHSSETLASEYVTHPFQGGRRPAHLRRGSTMSGIGQARLPESLMMGYAQVQGSFTLDGSLVDLGPFEAVKRKAVLGGQGGGVIGVESSRRSSGFLTSFGWGGIGSSIGELLGGSELSTIKEMRGAASSKSIPLLSTPQSILFVDLQLGPGESKTYDYSFKLPKGLPPTHRGRVIKITYSLVVGTQRAGGSKEQQVRSVDIPFRVLGSVNSYGEILGHDLLTPYIILRDQAKVIPYEKGHNSLTSKTRAKPDTPKSTINDFLSYVDELLDRQPDGLGLLSPTATATPSRRSSFIGDTTSAKQAIDLAIMRSNMSSESGQSSNRFAIARNGQRVGVIMLARPAYRLGETISMAIDFTDAEIPCYAVHAALETSEHVDPSLALRSEASIHRVTRKIYASSSEATLFARRIVFNPTIPITATPEFVTSGLNLEWKIRVEFVVPSSASTKTSVDGPGDQEGDSRDDKVKEGHHLLEEISHNDKSGLILVAAEHLECESFEVAVPLRVYGTVCNGLERLERDEALEEGLVV